ncbi:MAG: DUF2334 domain-containing protein [Promethearchaeota archaeon]
MKKIFFIIFLLACEFCYGNSIHIAFRNDDLSAKSDPVWEYKVLEIFRKYKIKPLFAVIPAIEGIELKEGMPIVESLRSWLSKDWIDIAIHGYTHEYKFSELPYDKQLKRLRAGKKIIDKLFSPENLIFAPPWNAVNSNTMKILEKIDFRAFSGYLGEIPNNDLKFINCNLNLFEGPLGNLSDILSNIEGVENDILLVILFHSSYDFNENSLAKLDSLLKYITSLDNVKVCSFSELIKDDNYKEFLKLVNNAGYHLKILKYNKYIRKILLKLPIISEYLVQKIKIAEKHYWSGNYEGVIQIYKEIVIRFWTIVSSLIIITILLVIWYFKKFRTKEKKKKNLQ